MKKICTRKGNLRKLRQLKFRYGIDKIYGSVARLER